MVKIKVPEVGESITEGTIASWLKGDGEYVESGEPIYELETDKITTEVPADDSGVLKIIVAEGETVAIGTAIGELKPGEGAPATPKKEAAPKPAPTSQAAAPAEPAATGGPFVARSGVEGDPTGEPVPPSKRRGGATPAAPTSFPTPTKAPARPGEREERKKMSTLRQRIAERLVASQHGTATLTTFNEIDMSAVMDLRKLNKEKFQATHGVNLGFMSFFVKAAIEALKVVPEVNASIDGTDVVYHNFYDVGVAVSTEKGLVVPVVRDADQMDFADIEKTINNLALRGREGKLTLDELTGGTFTISNGGIFGSLLSTPILNPPQTGILGMHNIVRRPVAFGDQVVIRPMMYVALSYDHRLIDGKEAVTFLKTIKEHIEQPGKFLLGLS